MPTITGSCDNSRYSLTCEYSVVQNVSANTSTITANVYLNGNGNTTSSSYWSCVINGTTVTSNKTASIGGKTLLGSRTWTVNHNSDGTCKTTISFSYNNGLSSSGTYTTKSGSGSATVTLTTIPRGSSLSLNRTSATIGSDAITITLNRASNSYTHKVQLYFGSYSALLAEGVGTSYTFTPNISLCSQIPNATSGTATIKIQTMNGSTWIAETSKTITLNVPSSVVPTIGSVTATGNNLLGSVYVAGKSTVTAKINTAVGAYGSTIKSYSLSGAGISSSSSSATSGLLSAGTHTLTGKITDSRGRTATKSISITVYSYYAPSLSIDFYRCNSDGTRNDNGTYARVYINQEIQNIGNANVNAKQYKVEYKRASATSWTVHQDWANISAYDANWIHNLGGNWDNAVTYDVRVSIKDSYNTVIATASIGTIACLLNIEQEGIGVGKVHECGALDVGGDIYSNGVKVLTEKHNLTWSDVGATSPTTPLASGAWYMNASQTITLSKKISECQHGICLEWRDYGNGQANAKDFVYTFIPKAHASRNNGKPLSILLPVYEQGSSAITKYLYVYDDRITGYATNDSAANSTMVVLSAVYEV